VKPIPLFLAHNPNIPNPQQRQAVGCILMKRFFKYFMNGFLIMAPITLTIYLVIAVVVWLDNLFEIPIPGIGYVPGLGILLVMILITLVGYIGSSFFVRPFLILTERILHRVPIVSIIFSSLKDLFEAFVGDNQKFNKPVLVRMTQYDDCYKLGFITQDSMIAINMDDMVAVYFPHSYNFSGELFVVSKNNIHPLELPSSELMKFVVSGGVSSL
jgi:uncharacterized membrane protein